LKCRACKSDSPAAATICRRCGALLRGFQQASSGERIRISVLFADVVNSTSLVANLDPEDAHALLETAVEQMIDAVHHFGGTINQIAGDGIQALFGAPLAQEDHALRACLAGLRMQGALEANASAATQPIRARVGINAGEVLLRPNAGDMQLGYSADGPVTHLARKVEQRAQPGGVWVTAEVMERVEGYVRGRLEDRLEVAGLVAPVEVYALTGATGARSHFDVAAQRGLFGFVGREAERARLDEALRATAAGHGQALAVVGEAGVGKSRLLWEFQTRARAGGARVLTSSSVAHGSQTPYAPIVELLRKMWPDALPTEAAIDAPPLCTLLDLPSDDAQWRDLEPARRRRRTRNALLAALTHEAQRPPMPLVLVIEDFQGADAQSREFVDALVGRLDTLALLLLLEQRADVDPRLSARSRFETLTLAPLTDTASTTLFRGLAGADPLLARLERKVLDSAEGNPLFLEEMVRMLFARGDLVGKPGAMHLSRPLHQIELPDKVKDVLAARIARLSPRDRVVLQAAAVIGKEVGHDLIQKLTGLSPNELRLSLESLVGAQLLVPGNADSGAEYRFKHTYTLEVAYQGVLRGDRRRLHARLLQLLEAQLGERLDQVERAAHHALCSHQWAQALSHLRRAAGRSLERSAMRETAYFLEHAIAAVAHLEPSKTSSEASIDLRLELRTPLLALGHVEQVLAVLREAQTLADAAGDRPRQARVAVSLCGQHWLAGEHAAAVETGERALELVQLIGDPSIIVPTRLYVGGALHSMGRHREAQLMLGANIELLSDLPPRERYGTAGLPLVFTLAQRAWSYTEVGEFEAARRDAVRAFALAESAGHGFSIQCASFALAGLQLALGEALDAAILVEDALAISGRERHRLWVPVLGPLLALALCRTGRCAQAATVIDQTVPQPDNPVLTTFTLLSVCEVYLQLGRIEAAARHAARAHDRACLRGERAWEAEALRLRGDVANQQPAQRDLAPLHFKAALRGAIELGLGPLAAACRRRLET
jgi:class 3 adenylate cyclase/tetratricopeptide (TPR) repeat protein